MQCVVGIEKFPEKHFGPENIQKKLFPVEKLKIKIIVIFRQKIF